MASRRHQKFSTSKRTEPTSQASSTALAAVALQDHMSRVLSLQDPFKQKKINHSLPVRKSDGKHARLHQHAEQVRKSNKGPGEKEYVLDARPPPLTLAQKLGLVEAPAQPLSDEDWKNVKEQSNAREDSRQPCVICKEDFGIQQQVLLSCSHVFHRTCLEAFEKFSGRKSCPMCRKDQYQKRVIHEGARQHRNKCATKIQATWRGYVVRSWYRKLRQTVPPKDPKLRKKFYEEKFQSITSRLVSSTEASSQCVDNLLSEIDESVAASRRIMSQVEKDHFNLVTEDEWERVQLKAVERCTTDCPICITPLTHQGLYQQKDKLNSPSRPTVLLSCTHVFHATCLEAFEEFSMDERRVCPVCRSIYQKKMV